MKKKGFTYLEVMIAISIFALLILMVMKLNATAESNLNSQLTSQKLMFVAEAQMENYKTTFTDVGSYPNGFQQDSSGNYVVVKGDNLITNNINLYLVTIRVRKSPLDASTEIILQSHVLKN